MGWKRTRRSHPIPHATHGGALLGAADATALFL